MDTHTHTHSSRDQGRGRELAVITDSNKTGSNNMTGQSIDTVSIDYPTGDQGSVDQGSHTHTHIPGSLCKDLEGQGSDQGSGIRDHHHHHHQPNFLASHVDSSHHIGTHQCRSTQCRSTIPCGLQCLSIICLSQSTVCVHFHPVKTQFLLPFANSLFSSGEWWLS